MGLPDFEMKQQKQILKSSVFFIFAISGIDDF